MDLTSASASDPCVSWEDVVAANERIAGDIVRTPCEPSFTLSALTGTQITVKFENRQFTGSFKDRGAANRLRLLSEQERARGVIAVSAGNHAQGVALAAKRLGVASTIVMPTSAPFLKVANTEALGATVVQQGQTLAEAAVAASELERTSGLFFVHPYDDPAVIAGQGTIAIEMLDACPDIDTLVAPIGGGGLLSGIAVAARAIKPDIRIIGVQSTAYASVAARRAGTAPPPGSTDTLADGIAVKDVGELTWPIIDALVDDVVVVSEPAIEQAVGMYLEIEKTVAEGAGAAPLAAVVEHPQLFAGRNVGLVLCGGNIDTRVLASVLMRELVQTDRISTLRVRVNDLPGQLAPIVSVVAERGANIIEIDHRRLFDPISARSTNIDLVVETRDVDHRTALVEALTEQGHEVAIL